jgi:hypothetical protein
VVFTHASFPRKKDKKLSRLSVISGERRFP